MLCVCLEIKYKKEDAYFCILLVNLLPKELQLKIKDKENLLFDEVLHIIEKVLKHMEALSKNYATTNKIMVVKRNFKRFSSEGEERIKEYKRYYYDEKRHLRKKYSS